MDLQPEKTDVKEKDTREVLGDYLREVTGFETAIVRTLIDLKNNPAVVLTSYLRRDHKYVSPFKILVGALALWVLVNSFFLDWRQVVEKAQISVMEWAQTVAPSSEAEDAAADRLLEKTPGFVDALYTKYFAPMVIIYLPIVAFLASRRTRRFGADFKSLLAVLSYSYGLNIVFFFVLSVFAYFGLLWLFLILCLPLAILQLMGKLGAMSFLSVRKYFVTGGLEIERELMKIVMILTVIITVSVLTWFRYS